MKPTCYLINFISLLIVSVLSACSNEHEPYVEPKPDSVELLDCSFNRLRTADIAPLRLMRLWCQGNRIGGEIPEHFDRLLEFEHDARYEYRPKTGTFTDHGYGWWYPGEPDKMSHTR